MDYFRIHDAIIIRADRRCPDAYTEKHHIVPRCMGGSDHPTNIIRLTPEEHYVIHQLLVKMYPNEKRLLFALLAMCRDRDGQRQNNKMFGWARRRIYAELGRRRRGVPRSPEVIEKMRIAATGKIPSAETIEKRASKLRGRKNSPEHVAKVAAALKGKQGTRRGMINSPEMREKQRLAALRRVYTAEELAARRQSLSALTPAQRSARAHKAWETKRRNAALADNCGTSRAGTDLSLSEDSHG